IVTSVCTGAALPARAGLLDGRRATTTKAFFQWVADQGPRVNWVKVARWVDDGKFVTSSGVSAGIDMALHVIARTHGREVSENVARAMEYDWHTDADWDHVREGVGSRLAEQPLPRHVIHLETDAVRVLEQV